MSKEELQKQIGKYLSDFDNLIDCGQIGDSTKIEDYSFHYKDLTKKEFLTEGREFIRTLLMILKSERELAKAIDLFSNVRIEDVRTDNVSD